MTLCICGGTVKACQRQAEETPPEDREAHRLHRQHCAHAKARYSAGQGCAGWQPLPDSLRALNG